MILHLQLVPEQQVNIKQLKEIIAGHSDRKRNIIQNSRLMSSESLLFTQNSQIKIQRNFLYPNVSHIPVFHFSSNGQSNFVLAIQYCLQVWHMLVHIKIHLFPQRKSEISRKDYDKSNVGVFFKQFLQQIEGMTMCCLVLLKSIEL